ncbi:DHH family phosphoesterase [Actinomadura citrea]|uniref:Phosphoesterase RecJ-like protein n=1 Tax=Actinomadura citrea TaxID=46158 RepID=A0A7Y9GBS7_9ACTN|nr:bifunctional oligoribonuclease/PAP phosphatase NrnA [Actinomadura citrea]NYE12230.1 phosphoesterase RecJ-like protein [Actinomadura citrea]GGT50469.1 phosphoesterase [Actinomadura citrea]
MNGPAETTARAEPGALSAPCVLSGQGALSGPGRPPRSDGHAEAGAASGSGVPPESKPGGPFEAGVASGLGTPSRAGLPAEAGGAPAEPDWDRAVELIREAGEICLACHVVPDGDALGSMLALAQALRTCGKRCLASFGEPFGVPAILRFLPGQELLVEPARMPRAPKLMISLDAAGRARLGSLAGAADRAGALIVIDHHASNTGFGGVRLVDPDAAATAVLVEELIRRLGVPLDRDIAQGLYAGLASDTGSFKYPSTTPEVHDLAGRLLTAGVRPETVSRELWDRAPFDYLQVLAGALARARLERDAAGGRGLVWTAIAREDRRGLPYEQLEGIIDQLRRTDEAEVAVVCKETDDGRWYFSARSKGHIDLSRVCAALDGGGHREMAGFVWGGPVDEALDRLRALLPSGN